MWCVQFIFIFYYMKVGSTEKLVQAHLAITQKLETIHTLAFGDRGVFVSSSQSTKKYDKQVSFKEWKSRTKFGSLQNIQETVIIKSICLTTSYRLSIVGFDATIGFPGEGPKAWSKSFEKPFTMATWNTHSLSRERLNYCKNLGFDIIT